MIKIFFTPILALTLLTPLILAQNSEARARQKCRGCSGKIAMKNVSTGIHPINEFSTHPVYGSRVNKDAPWIALAETSGRACDKNANRCRTLATRAIFNMYGNIWNKRWSHSTEGASSIWPPNKPGRPVAGLRWVSFYPHIRQDSLKDRIEAATCCKSRVPANGRYKFIIKFNVSGDTGCGDLVKPKRWRPFKAFDYAGLGFVTTKYNVSCKDVRSRGLCGVARRTNPE